MCATDVSPNMALCGADCGDDEWLRVAGGGGYRLHRNREIENRRGEGEG